MTVGYIPTTSTDDSIINVSSDTPTKYMDYLFERQSGSWYLTGLTESETKAESTESTPARMCRNPWQKAMCRMPFLQQPVRILLRLRQTAPLQTRAWIHRRRNSPPTAPRHRRTKAQPARRHNTKQKYRIQGRCFVSGILFEVKFYDHQSVPQVRHHVPDHPQLHQDVVGRSFRRKGRLPSLPLFSRAKASCIPLSHASPKPCLWNL